MKKIVFCMSLLLISASCDKKISALPPAPLPVYNYSHQLQVGNKILMVEVVSDAKKMEQGLSDRISMGDNEGMLFDFGNSNSSTPAFWMKGMKFNLDLIWIKKNSPSASSGYIIGITADVPFLKVDDGNLPTYSPPSPINEVLEVNAGWAKGNNLKIGDVVELKD